MKLSVSIMAHPRRKEMVEELLKQLPATQVAWDTDNNVWHTCRASWELYDKTADYHVVIQDDALVCDDFITKAIEILKSLEKPQVVCFYVGDKAFRHGSKSFTARKIYNEVAICFPIEHIEPMINFCDMMNSNTDRNIERYCKRKKLSVYYPLPSLVDHRDTPSLYREIYQKPEPDKPRKAFHFIGKVDGTVGIGVTTHNRKEICLETVRRIKEFTPNAKVVVVDDASEDPPLSDYRFETNVGISRAKNKCLELLDDCDHIFLFDDDCYPTELGWEQDYIRSPYPHLSYTFDKARGKPNGNTLLSTRHGHKFYKHACGCMLYIDKRVLETVGGFDIRFTPYGHEHINFSQRIADTFSQQPFIDVENPKLYALDQHTEIRSSFNKNKKKTLRKNHRVVYENKYFPYKFTPNKVTVLAVYFTQVLDPQRQRHWLVENDNPYRWYSSIKDNGSEAVLFSDTELDIPTVITTCTRKPSVERYFVYRDWLKENKRDYVFLTDSTDVEMVSPPQPQKDTLYVGDEEQLLNCLWIKQQADYLTNEDIKDFVRTSGGMTLLNAGIIGGDYETVSRFVDLMCQYLEPDTPCRDMPIVNYVARKYFNPVHGYPVNTPFKKDIYINNVWFKHK